MNPQKLLEQFLGSSTLPQSGSREGPPGAGGGLGDLIGGALGQFTGQSAAGGSGIPGGALGGLAVGGLLGVLLSQKQVRKLAGGALGYGGAAVLGALAFRAYQNWKAGQQPNHASPATLADSRQGAQFAPAAGADGKPFALAIVRTMIAAANADGHVGADEQKQIFEAVNRGALDAEDKAFMFDALQNPSTPAQLAALANGQEQAAELYLAARLAIDVDHPAERAFLGELARALRLPDALVAHLDAQVGNSLAPAGS